MRPRNIYRVLSGLLGPRETKTRVAGLMGRQSSRRGQTLKQNIRTGGRGGGGDRRHRSHMRALY